MEAVDGPAIYKAGLENKAFDIATSAVDGLKRLHALPLAKTGIGDEASVGLQSEMVRWAMLLQRAPEELTVRAGELGGLRPVQLPAARAPARVPGYYTCGNSRVRA